ncbi:TetR/AcrR family transcriptional regulator [Sandarakinorhabdus sp. AAP62]|uniref:TetR/AcrR family transcriptional regulator n=1 Tax=Sandarakinorhabdus sp. AAP62 TaxID=1248916 RepID=UPI0009DB31DF|nr:TetR/AcrR family transcriptional regulator [Sandarakinorhabdus sp. AAP62]
MSAKSRLPDRRQLRTRAALLTAFRDLMFAQRYDRIDVAAVCVKANVGRSTFYAHFAGKDALLAASMQPLLDKLAEVAATGDDPSLLWLLEHFWEQRRHGRIMFAPPLRAVLERALADAIQARLGSEFRIAALQIAAAQLTAVDAWLTGSISATPPQMAARISATARLVQ